MVQALTFDGPEFQVDPTYAGNQTNGVAAALTGGGFVIVWVQSGTGGSGDDIYVQRYDANRNPVGTRFPVNSTTSGDQYDPAVTALANGDFVVTWTSYGQDGSGDGILAQRFAANGSALGTEWRVNSVTSGDQYRSSTAALADGGFVVVWTGGDGFGGGISGQRYSASGVAVGGEFAINSPQADSTYLPSVAALSGGGFVVTWISWGQDGDGEGVFAQRFDAAGAQAGAEFQVNSQALSDQYSPRISSLAGGGFVIVWTSWDQDGDGEGIFAQIFDATGNRLGGEFQVNTQFVDDQYKPSVSSLGDGGFIVTWASDNGTGSDIHAQRYSAAGSAIDAEFSVGTNNAPYAQWQPSVVSLADGGLAFAWAANMVNGNGWGVEARTMTLVAPGVPRLVSPQADLRHGIEDTQYVVTKADLLQGYAGEVGETLSIIALSATNATVSSSGSGAWAITPLPDYNGPIALSYTVKASGGGAAAATQTFVVDVVNDAPVLSESKAVLDNGEEDTPYSIELVDLLSGYSDVDGDDLAILGLTANHGTIAQVAPGEFVLTPQANYNGTVTLSYQVIDGNGGSLATTLTLTLDDINDAPSRTGASAVLPHGTEDVSYTVRATDLLAGFTDAEGDAISVSQVSADHGLVTAGANGTFVVSPDANYNGEMVLSYRVADSNGAETFATLSYIVDPVADGPDSIDVIGGTVAEMSPSGTVVAQFVGHNADNLSQTYSLVNNAGGRFAINATTGMLTVVSGSLLDFETAQSHSITVRVTTSSGASFNQDFGIRLVNVVENQTRTLTSSAETFLAPSDDNWSIDAGKGNDVITTLGGNDTIRGGTGNDTLFGGGGNDLFTFRGTGDGYDSIDGGSGYDTITALANSTRIGLTSIANIEAISGGGYSGVTIAGSSGADRLDFSGTAITGIVGIEAGSGSDTVIGSAGNDTIRGSSGNDVISGGAGNDVFTVTGTSDGYDSFDGGSGLDQIIALSNNTAIGLSAISGVETISADGHSGVYIRSGSTSDRLDFSGTTLVGITRIDGGGGADTIIGSAGADTIRGGSGADLLTGGSGNDIFAYSATSESRSRSSSIDTITHFQVGQDRIDLSAIDANTRTSGNGAFVFIGTSTFHNVAGELRFQYDGVHHWTVVTGDIDGNGTVDFEIHLNGNLSLSASDFVL